MGSLKYSAVLIVLVILAGLFIPGETVRAQGVLTCSFWSNGVSYYKGNLITSGDQIKAYDPRGKLCGETTGTAGHPGSFLINVYGVYDGSPYEGGANEGEAITFKINGETAAVVSGSNVWHNLGSYQCNIEVSAAPPEADPGGPYSGYEGSPIQFNGNGSTATTYSWNFGDGGTGTGPTPSHTYTDNGTYTVSLTVTNGGSQTDTKTTLATVSNVAPTAEAGSNKTSNEGQSVSFSGSATDPGTQDTQQGFTYHWNFGDGHTASGQNVSHVFQDDGIYTVTLTVTDKDGGQGSDQAIATVNNLPPQNVNAGSNKTGNEGSSIQFSGSATDPGPVDVLMYHWNFGDGYSADGQTVSHIYADNGTYSVVLTVSDGDDNATDQLTATIYNLPPVANAGGPYQNVIVNQSVQFSGSATDPGSADTFTYQWDLDNDGQYDDFNGRYPSKTYNSAGVFPISLKVTDDDGASDTDNTVVTVSEGVPVTIEASPEGKGLQVIVNSTLYDMPHTFYFRPGATVFLEAPEDKYLSDDTRYHFKTWNDGGLRVREIIVPSSPVSYSANYRKQFLLEIDTRGIDAQTQGEGWYIENTSASISVDSLAADSTIGIQYHFESWSGEGTGHYSGPDREAGVTMSGPIIERVNWHERYYLGVETGTEVDTLSGFYEPDTSLTFSVSSFSAPEPGSRREFIGWVGTGEGSYTGPDTMITVVLHNPIWQVAQWNSQYLLTVESEHGTVWGGGWFGEGEEAEFGISSTVIPGTDSTRLAFIRWQGSGLSGYNGSDTSGTIIMMSPVTQSAIWKNQYTLRVNIFPEGKGEVIVTPVTEWYTEGDTVSLQANSLDPDFDFTRWAGDADSYENPLPLVMNNPKTVQARFASASSEYPAFKAIPDIQMREDMTFALDIGNYLIDPNHPLLHHTFEQLGTSHITTKLDSTTLKLDLTPAANWNGSESLILQVMDPWGGSDVDTFKVTVLPVNDPPEKFDLLTPMNNEIATSFSGYVFLSWEASSDIDGDKLYYKFTVDTASSLLSPASKILVNLTDTYFLMNTAQYSGPIYWKVEVTDGTVTVPCRNYPFKFLLPTAVNEEMSLPVEFTLYRNYPNPFNPRTTIRYFVPARGQVAVRVFDTRGRLVDELVNDLQDRGMHQLDWPVSDAEDVSSGIYILQVIYKESIKQIKMMLLK